MHLLKNLLLSALCTISASAIGVSWRAGPSVATTHAAPLSMPEGNGTLSLPRAITEMVEMVQNMRKMPHCKQTAASDLVNSCATYDATIAQASHSTQTQLEHYQKLFAIRMSSCELSDAAQPLPSVCNVAARGGSGEVSEPQTQDCLDALYQETNTWTTYTSMKTQGLFMCHAMRAEQDKDEKLHVFSVLLENMSGIGAAVGNTKADIEALARTFQSIKTTLLAFRDEASQDQQDLKSAIKDSFTGIHSDITSVSGDVNSLVQTMGKAFEDLEGYTNRVNEAFDKTHALSTQAGEVRSELLAKIRSDLDKARDIYEYHFQLALDKFGKQIYAMTNSVEVASAMSGKLLDKFSLLNGSFDAPMKKVGELLHQANNLSDAQSRMFVHLQAYANTTLHNLHEANDVAKTLNSWVSPVVRFVRIFSASSLDALRPFLIWYSVVLCVLTYAYREVSGSFWSMSIGSVAPALVLGSWVDPLKLGQNIIKYHPTFWNEVPPYLSMATVFTAGIAMTVFVSRWRRAPAYDPAAQLSQYTSFRDDLELDEQKRYHIPY